MALRKKKLVIKNSFSELLWCIAGLFSAVIWTLSFPELHKQAHDNIKHHYRNVNGPAETISVVNHAFPVIDFIKMMRSLVLITIGYLKPGENSGRHRLSSVQVLLGQTKHCTCDKDPHW